jgi:peroxiredoxin
MAPNLAAARGGVIMTWLEPVRDGHRLRFSRFADGRWSAPVTVAEGPAIVANWADVPSAAEADGGALVAHWAERRAGGDHAYDVVLARSTDRGATWKRIGTANDDGVAAEHGFVTLTPEGDRVRAFWLDGRDSERTGDMTLRTALVGERVEESELLDARVCECCSTAAARTKDGVVLAYRDRSGDELRDISFVRRAQSDRSGDRGQAWTPPRAVHRDGWRIVGCPVNGPAVAARGRAVTVAWYTHAGRRHSVRAAFSVDGGATFAPAIEVDGPRDGRAPLGRVSVVLGARGEALVSWVAAERGGAEILVRRVAADGRLGAERRIAGTGAGRRSGIPRMVAVQGGLLLAWIELAPRQRLRAALLPVRAVAPVGDEAARALPSAEDVGGPGEGEVMPDYRAASLDGRPADLARLRGQVVLLNLWATWCVPCRQELTDLAALHRARSGDGLTIVAASVDDRESRDEVVRFVRRRKLPFAVWLDPDDRASGLLGVRSMPTTLLIGRDGTIRWRRDGVLDPRDEAFGRALDRALAEPASKLPEPPASQGSGP